MQFRHSGTLKFPLAVVVCLVLVSGHLTFAPTGFKANKEIWPFTDVTRENWVALPYVHQYRDMQDICDAQGLTPGAGKVRRLDAQTGIWTSWDCGAFGFSPCLQHDSIFCTKPSNGTPEHVKRIGLVITNDVKAGGVIAGSHLQHIFSFAIITLYPRGPAPIGDNYFSVLYHTCDVTMQDLCEDLGLPGSSAIANTKIERRNAVTGVTTSWDCQAAGTAPNLVLLEAVRITYSGTSPISFLATHTHPCHF